MLTITRTRTCRYFLILLISLSLLILFPLLTGNFANAEETQKSVDITYGDVDGNEADFNGFYDEEGLEDDEEIYFDEDSEENLDENSDEISDEDSDEDSDKDSLKGKKRSDMDSDNDTDKEVSSEDSDIDEDEDSDGDLDEDLDEDESIEDDEYINEDENEDIDDEDIDEDDVENVEDQEQASEDAYKDEEYGGDIEDPGFYEGFPKSYQPYLEELHAAHPSWQFVPADTGVDWDTALDKEDSGTHSLISPNAPSAQRESSSKKYDGYWYLANRKTIAHYMDPRNFLNERNIYLFLQQTYDENSQNTDTVSEIIEGSFMEERNPGGDYDSFASCIVDAGAQAGVNPNVLAAMIIMEQGWDGSSLSSGKKEGYKGYYNFFNIGAWTTDSMSSVERGLWYAKGEGEGNTSYERPWDSPFKAILGGAEFYYNNYISANQNTYYTKKFNVMNGADSIGSHEYMTNVAGAAEEGLLVKQAYEDFGDLPVVFEIPVYSHMPKKACNLPE